MISWNYIDYIKKKFFKYNKYFKYEHYKKFEI